MHIAGMTICGIPPFTEPVEFEFDERVNLLVGPNATGKSTILRALREKTEFEGRFSFQFSKDWARHPQMAYPSRRTQTDSVSQTTPKVGVDMLPWIYVPAARLNLPLSHDHGAMRQLQSSSLPVPVIIDGEEVGPTRPLERMRQFISSYYLDGSIIQKYYKVATDLFRVNRSTARDITRDQSAKEIAYKCVQTICSEVLANDREPVDYIYNQPVEQEDYTVTNIHDDMGVHTSDRRNLPLFAGDLSAGTQSTLLWVWYLAIEMANFRYYQDDWQTQPSILMIDEIENNLHPTWQRRVIPTLLEHFPKLQIFATTHSPFVAAGREAGQVHQLIRNADGTITGKTIMEQTVGLTIDEISRKYLEIQDPTDLATAEAAAELRRLRDEGPRDTAEEEARRQQRMQALRRLVNRDLLAGGPAAAQRELFEQQFAEALEKYQQSQDLGQENG